VVGKGESLYQKSNGVRREYYLHGGNEVGKLVKKWKIAIFLHRVFL